MRIEEKKWDSGVLGVRCGKVHCGDKPIKTEGWDFLHARPGVDEEDYIATLEKAGFVRVSKYLTLQRDLRAHPPDISEINFPYREGTENDAEYVGGLAALVFIYDRHHADTRVPRKVADDYKHTWGRNLCLGHADSVFVATDPHYGIIGFSSTHECFVGLNGVCPKFRRRGIGFGLVELACKSLMGYDYAFVSTQRANMPALNMYFKRCHFRLQGMAYDFHWIRPGLEW